MKAKSLPRRRRRVSMRRVLRFLMEISARSRRAAISDILRPSSKLRSKISRRFSGRELPQLLIDDDDGGVRAEECREKRR